MRYNRILTCALAILAIASCKSNDEVFENKAFIDATEYKNEVRVAIDENVQSLSRSLYVSVAKPEDQDLNVSFVVSPELVDTYRSAYYDEDAELLPEANYNSEALSAIIKAGDVKSSAAKIDFINLGKDKLDYTKSYVLPVTVQCDKIDVLQRAKTMFFVVKKASLINYVADINSNLAYPEWGEFDEVESLEQCTMEAYVNAHSFNNKGKVHTIMGIEDHFLIRVGDSNIPSNQIQVAVGGYVKALNTSKRGDLTSDKLKLKTDRWYHIAVTFNKGFTEIYLDGKLIAAKDISNLGTATIEGEPVEITFKEIKMKVPHSDESDGKPRCFWIGHSYDDGRCFDGMISEVRVWNRVLTADEINSENHFYKLYNPADDESLLAYWKFDEGVGKNIKDHSKYGNDLVADHDCVWYPVSLPTAE